MATLRELAIAITARTGQFGRGIQNVLGGLGKLERRTKRANRGFSAMTRTFQALPGLIGVAGGGAVIKSIGAIGESFDQAMNQSLAIMNNVKHLQASVKKDLVVFKRVASMVKSFTWVSAYLPIVLTLVTVVLFLLSVKPVMVDIVSMPVKDALHTIRSEIADKFAVFIH